MTKQELKDYLVREAGYNYAHVSELNGCDLLNAYLEYNGIIGYTYNIIDVVKAIGIENL